MQKRDDLGAINFDEKISKRLLNSFSANKYGDIFGVVGPASTGKSYVLSNLISYANKKRILYLDIEITKILKSDHLLLVLCKLIRNELKTLNKKYINQKIFDFKTLDRILTLKISQDKIEIFKEKSKSILLSFLKFFNALLEVDQIKLITTFDNLDSFSDIGASKIMEITLYIKTFVPMMSVFLFYNKSILIDKISKKLYERATMRLKLIEISLEQSWKNYEINNQIIYKFIEKNNINNVSIVNYLLNQQLDIAKFINEFSKKVGDHSLILRVASELELINFVLDFIRTTDLLLWEKIKKTIMAYKLICDEPSYVVMEYQNKDNKEIMEKLASIITMVDDNRIHADGENKLMELAKNILGPNRNEWNTYFVNADNEDKNIKNNINRYIPILISVIKLRFFKIYENNFCFVIENDDLPETLRYFMEIMIEQAKALKMYTNNDNSDYYNLVIKFIFYYAIMRVEN